MDKKKDLWSVRVSTEFRQWAENAVATKGLDKALCTTAAVYYILGLPESQRQRIIRLYRDFEVSGFEVDAAGLSPWERANLPVEEVIPPGSVGPPPPPLPDKQPGSGRTKRKTGRD